MTLTLEIWPWFEFMTHPIVWNIIQIQYNSRKLWPGQSKLRQTYGLRFQYTCPYLVAEGYNDSHVDHSNAFNYQSMLIIPTLKPGCPTLDPLLWGFDWNKQPWESTLGTCFFSNYVEIPSAVLKEPKCEDTDGWVIKIGHITSLWLRFVKIRMTNRPVLHNKLWLY